MPDTVEEIGQLAQVRAEKTEKINALASLVDKRKEARDAFKAREDSEDAKPSDEERAAFTVAEEEHDKEFDRREREVKEYARRERELAIIEERRQEAAEASRGTSVSITSEPFTYRNDNARQVSYFRDLASRYHATFASQFDDVQGAQERLERHGKEMADELPKRDAERTRLAEKRIEQAEREFTGSVLGARQRRGFEQNPFERRGARAGISGAGMEARVNPNRTDGQGGYLVPPIYLMDETIPLLRAGRTAADRCRQLPVPPGTDSINVPKIATGTATGVQTADAASVTSVDFTDTIVTAGVKTIAGQEDVSIQLLEQSPGDLVDQVIIADLTADYNLRLDTQVLSGTGSSGQVLGILPVSNYTSTNTITWTSSTPTGNAFNQAVGAAASKTAYTRYDLTNVAAMLHPRRWFWFATATDGISGASPTNGRPLVNMPGQAFNTAALEVGDPPPQGLVGHFPFGVPTYIDGNVPAVATSGGAISGGTSDLGVVAKWDDIWLFEGAMRTRVLPEVLSGTLQIRFQIFNYIALLVRYGQSISVIQGTGMAAPTAAVDTSIVF